MEKEAFWAGFANELSNWTRMLGNQAMQIQEEEREEEKQIRAEGRQLINYEKKGAIDEKYAIKEVERLTKQQEGLAEFGQQLDKNLVEWKAEYAAQLGGALNDPNLLKLQQKAMTSGNSMEQAQWLGIRNAISAAEQGEVEFDPAVISGLPPFARSRFDELIFRNKKIEQDYQLQKDNFDRQTASLLEQIEYHKRIQESRDTMDTKREIDTLTGFDKRIEEADKAFTNEYTSLMTDLEPDIIDAQGRFKIGGLIEKNPSLLDPETGGFDMAVVERLIKKHPRFGMRFKRLFTLQANLMKHQIMKDTYLSGGEQEAGEAWTSPKGEVFEVGKIYTVGGKKLKHTGNGNFEEVK